VSIRSTGEAKPFVRPGGAFVIPSPSGGVRSCFLLRLVAANKAG
jgi:hypothetical protein